MKEVRHQEEEQKREAQHGQMMVALEGQGKPIGTPTTPKVGSTRCYICCEIVIKTKNVPKGTGHLSLPNM